MSDNPWHYIDKFPGECTMEVSRKGNTEPCDKPAYAIAFDAEGYWPVCQYSESSDCGKWSRCEYPTCVHRVEGSDQ